MEQLDGDQVRLLLLLSRVQLGTDGGVYNAAVIEQPHYDATIPGTTTFTYVRSGINVTVWLPTSVGSGARGVPSSPNNNLGLIVFAAQLAGRWFAIGKLKAVLEP